MPGQAPGTIRRNETGARVAVGRGRMRVLTHMSRPPDERLDLLIIGAGPAGLSAAHAAAREGLNYLVIEKGLIADTIYHYPVGRTVFSTPGELELREESLRPCREKPTREAV